MNQDVRIETSEAGFQARYRIPGCEWSSWGHVVCGVRGHEMELRAVGSGALLKRAEELHLKAGMPWNEAEQLALSEAGIGDPELDELIGECAQLGLDTLLATEDELRTFARALLVHAKIDGGTQERAVLLAALNRQANVTEKAIEGMNRNADIGEAETARLRQALEDVANPVAMWERSLPEGCVLNGAMVAQMANDPETYRRIANAALEA